MDMGKLNLELI